MTTYTTTVPGLPGGPISTNHPIKIKLLAATNTYQRPGVGWAGQRIMVQHGTGNGNSMAAGEARWLVDSKADGSQQSYHYITDDRETWCCLPINEHGWHAADGDGPGNMLGIANEMVENSALWANSARALQCIENTAEIMGITAARMNATGPKQHWDFNYLQTVNRHDCPNKLRYVTLNGRKAWDIYVERYRFYEALEKERMTGAPVVPPDHKPTGDLVFVARFDLYARYSPGFYDYAAKKDNRILNKQKEPVVVKAGVSGTIVSGPVVKEGVEWYDVKIEGQGISGTCWVQNQVLNTLEIKEEVV